jgi:Rod binding domain-containing protein
MSEKNTLSGIDIKHTQSLAQHQASTQVINSLSNKDVASSKELEKAAAGFEALMLHEMLKSMWNTVETTGLLGEDSNEAQIYRDMFNQAIADKIAEERSIGVKDFIRKEIIKHDKASQEKESL